MKFLFQVNVQKMIPYVLCFSSKIFNQFILQLKTAFLLLYICSYLQTSPVYGTELLLTRLFVLNEFFIYILTLSLSRYVHTNG